jgi:hypothetical protein
MHFSIIRLKKSCLKQAENGNLGLNQNNAGAVTGI